MNIEYKTNKLENYTNVLHSVRPMLIAMANIIITILVIFVYPLERFGTYDEQSKTYTSVLDSYSASQVQLIILSVLLGVILTYYFIIVASRVTQKNTIILHLLVLLNMSAASIIIKIPVFPVFMMIIFLVGTEFLPKFQKTLDDRFISIGSLFSYIIATVFIWWMKFSNGDNYSYLEVFATEIILSIILNLKYKKYQLRDLFFLPILQNILLTPIIQVSGSDFQHLGNLNLLLFSIFVLNEFIVNWTNDGLTYRKISMIISPVFLMINYLVSNSVFHKFTSIIIDNGSDFSISIYGLLMIFYSLYWSFKLFRRNILQDTQYLGLSIFSLVYFFVFANFISGLAYSPVSQIILTTVIVITYFLLLWKENNGNKLFPILQSIAIFLLSISFENSILLNMSMIIHILALLILNYRNKDQDMSMATLLSISVLVIMNVFLSEVRGFVSLNFSLMMISIISLCFLQLTSHISYDDKQLFSKYRIKAIFLSLSMFILSIMKYDMITGISTYDIGVILFLISVLFVGLRNKEESLLVFSAYTITALGFLLTIFSINDNFVGITYPVIGAILLFPSIVMLLKKYNREIISLQFFNIVYGSIFYAQNIIDDGYSTLRTDLNMVTLLYPIIILVNLYIFWKRDEQDGLIIMSVLNSLFIVINVYLSHTIGQVVDGLILLLCTIVILSFSLLKSKKNSIESMISGAISTLFMSIYNFDVGYFVKNFGFITDVHEVYSLHFSIDISLAYIVFISLTTLIWVGQEKLKSVPVINLGLTISYLVVGLLSSSSKIPPPLVLGAIIIITNLIHLKSEGELTEFVFSLSSIAMLLLFIVDNQLTFIILGNTITISMIMYILYSLITVFYWVNWEERSTFIIAVNALTNFIVFVFYTWNLHIPVALLMLIIVFFVSIPVIRMNIKNTILSFIVNAFLSYYLIIDQFITETPVYPVEHKIAANIFMFVYSVIMLIFLQRTTDKNHWIVGILSFSLPLYFMGIHPNLLYTLLLGVIVLMLSFLQYRPNLELNRIINPFIQVGGFFVLMVNEIESSGFIYENALITSILICVSVGLNIVIWYLNGTDNQFITLINYLFIQTLFFSFISLAFHFVISEFILFSFLLIAVILITVFSKIIYRTSTRYLKITLLISQLSIIIYSRVLDTVLVSTHASNTQTMLKLLVDWLVFVPILVQVSLFVKYYVDTNLVSNGNLDLSNASRIVIISQVVMIASAILIGISGILSLKLFASAITLWVFATKYIDKSISWVTSLNSVITLALVLAQIPTEGGEREIFYFLALCIFGLLMIVAAWINEYKFHGEPFTASMSITGGMLMALTAITPLLRGNIFPQTLFDIETSRQLVNFLPNFIWALEGLGIFIFSMRTKKEYLRKFALSILLLDIFKTAINIFSLPNVFIRIIGSFVLGLVLIYIFYLFSNDDTPNVEIIEEDRI